MHRLNRCWWIVRSKSTTLKHPRNWILDCGIPFYTNHTPPRGGSFLLMTCPGVDAVHQSGVVLRWAARSISSIQPLWLSRRPQWASFGYIGSGGRRPRGHYLRDQGGLSLGSAVLWSPGGTCCQNYRWIGQGFVHRCCIWGAASNGRGVGLG